MSKTLFERTLGTSKLISAVAALGMFVSLGADLTFAANVHFKSRSLVFTDQGLSLNAQGSLAGLGNQDIVLLLTAEADVTSVCTNPAGNTQPPGHNPAPITVSGSQAIPAGSIKNGSVKFSVSTTAPPSTIAGAPDCPNAQWTETISDLAFTSATLTVQQPPGTTVLSASCTFSPHTANGAVPGGTVTCH